jgi:hypothetical protein
LEVVIAAIDSRRLFILLVLSNPTYTSFFPSFMAREGCASQPIHAQSSPHRQVTTRIIWPCWFLEGGPQQLEGGGIMGNGAGSIIRGSGGDDNLFDLLLPQQPPPPPPLLLLASGGVEV